MFFPLFKHPPLPEFQQLTYDVTSPLQNQSIRKCNNNRITAQENRASKTKRGLHAGVAYNDARNRCDTLASPSSRLWQNQSIRKCNRIAAAQDIRARRDCGLTLVWPNMMHAIVVIHKLPMLVTSLNTLLNCLSTYETPRACVIATTK